MMRFSVEREEELVSRNPWGDCSCGAPATLDSLDRPLKYCNDCRPDDNYYRCSDCGNTYKREGIGHVNHVVSVEHGDRVWRCHECARAKFKVKR